MNPDKQLEQYKVSRYLRNAKDDALSKRLDDIGANLWSTDRDGNVIPTRNHKHRSTLLILYIDTLYEKWLRHPADLEFNEDDLRRRMASGFIKPTLKSPIDFEPTCLAKFGQRKYILDSLNKGILRIAPAQSYQDPSLNSAQKDDELSHCVQTPNQEIKFKLHGLDGGVGETELQVKPLDLFQYMNVPNFYVWCCGLGYDSRLFMDFDCDAALIVKNIDVFKKRFADAVRFQLPFAKFDSREVGYYDTYVSHRSQLTPIFSKHIKYLYQNEYRFSWRLEDSSNLEPFFIELGPLHDIATVVELA